MCVCVCLWAIVCRCRLMIGGGISRAVGSPVPEEVTGAELICFHLILPDSTEMRPHFPLCVCVHSSNSRGGEAMERGFPGQAIRLWHTGWLELLHRKGVISILVKWSATLLLTSLATTLACMHSRTITPPKKTPPTHTFIPPLPLHSLPFVLMKCPSTHY